VTRQNCHRDRDTCPHGRRRRHGDQRQDRDRVGRTPGAGDRGGRPARRRRHRAFIARYRKEITGTLDDTQLRNLEERLRYLRELEERRAAILESIRSQGKLDDALAAAIAAADSKARLEDIYLPYKPKRRTKAQIAREAGLEPLADLLLGDPTREPQIEASAYVDAEKGVGRRRRPRSTGPGPSWSSSFAENADLIGELRELMWSRGRLVSKVRAGKETDGAKFADYFEFDEAVHQAAVAPNPGHVPRREGGDARPHLRPRAGGPAGAAGVAAGPLGLREPGRPRGRRQQPWAARPTSGCRTPCAGPGVPGYWSISAVVTCAAGYGRRPRTKRSGYSRPICATCCWPRRPAPGATMGLDPGFRTGVKVAVVDATGKVVATDTIYPHVPQHKWDDSIVKLAALCQKHDVELISIGNGTASRETDKLAADLLAKFPALKATKVMVSEAGASVYSASAYASQELPGMDVSLRGAVSIARRLQDPLAELVKIDPKSIGVGQYQHDLAEGKLVPLARLGRRGLRERRRRRPQHRVGAVAHPGLRHHHRPGREHRRPPRCERPVPVPQGPARRAPTRPQGVRAVRRLPAHPRRRGPAGLLVGAPRGVPGGAADRGRLDRRHHDADRQRRRVCAW